MAISFSKNALLHKFHRNSIITNNLIKLREIQDYVDTAAIYYSKE